MHQISLELSLKISSRWHAGAGEGSLILDRIVRRDSAGQPYIPGSTLKGVVRESCERMCRTLGFPEPQDPHSANLRDAGVFSPLSRTSSPVNALFGNKFEGGELFFRNARAKSEEDFDILIEISRTAMSRGLRTVKPKHLFSSEYSRPLTLESRIDGFHPHLLSYDSDKIPFAYCLLIASIRNVDRIGADKSTGCGMVDIGIVRATYNGRVVKLEEIFDELDSELYEICLEEQESL